jgi:hypothetical protein
VSEKAIRKTLGIPIRLEHISSSGAKGWADSPVDGVQPT